MGNWEMLVNFVLAAGMTLIILIITFLLKFKKQLPHRLLSVFFASCFFFLLYYFGYLHRSRSLGAVAVLFGNGMGYLLGPLLLHYIKSLALPRRYVIRPLLWQLVPFGVHWLCVSLPLSISMFSDVYLADFGAWYAHYADYFNLVENVFVLTYFFVSIRFIDRLKQLYTNSYSDTDGKDLAWCRQLIIGLIIIVTIDIGLSIYELNYPPIEWNIGMVTAFLFVGLFTYLAYKGMWQSQILVPEFLLDNAVVSEIPSDGPKERAVEWQPPVHVALDAKAETDTTEIPAEEQIPASTAWALNNLSDDDIEKLKTRLYEVLDGQKPYLNDSLTLGELAALVPISDKKLSELLNQHVRISFYDLINNYRVETVKRKMQAPGAEQFTLLALAFESGFKSKTSFNRVFKQKTGVSPSQFYDSCRQAEKA